MVIIETLVHVCAQLLSRVRLIVIPRTIAHQAILSMSMGFSRQEYCCELPCPSSGDFPDPGTETTFPKAPALEADSLQLSHQGSPI